MVDRASVSLDGAEVSGLPHPVRVQHEGASASEQGHRWALVVGISDYQDDRLNLRFADRDARAFAKLILTEEGGGFDSDKVLVLLNEQATAGDLQRALRSFLKKPAKEDFVVIYLACHGQPDVDRPSNVYILPHDTDLDDVAGTAVPMREIDHCLRETLQASKVVILADTCHSGAIGGRMGTPRNVQAAAAINHYLYGVSEAKDGIALLTSAEANQVALEDERWGGGHGVFTYHLLEGKKGAADSTGNGIVTVGELFEYVRDEVKRDTDHRQHPAIGTSPYDRSLPMAAPGRRASTAAAAEPGASPTPEREARHPVEDAERTGMTEVLEHLQGLQEDEPAGAVQAPGSPSVGADSPAEIEMLGADRAPLPQEDSGLAGRVRSLLTRGLRKKPKRPNEAVESGDPESDAADAPNA